MPNISAPDLTGNRYGSFLVIGITKVVSNDGFRRTLQICRCDCGNIRTIEASVLRRGKQKSCGCYRNDVYGMGNTAEYNAWYGAKQRCYDHKHNYYRDYGGRGITMSSEWRASFLTFLADMGFKHSPQHSLERINNNKGYSKDNCKWVTRIEQHSNTRANVYVTAFGERFTVAEWGRRLGVSCACVHAALKRGRTIEWLARRDVCSPLSLYRISALAADTSVSVRSMTVSPKESCS